MVEKFRASPYGTAHLQLRITCIGVHQSNSDETKIGQAFSERTSWNAWRKFQRRTWRFHWSRGPGVSAFCMLLGRWLDAFCSSSRYRYGGSSVSAVAIAATTKPVAATVA